MNRLLIDCGNSRLKWALQRGIYHRGQAFASQGAIELGSLAALKSGLAPVFASAGVAARTVVCSVAGEPVTRALRAAARHNGMAAPQFVRSSASAAGVRNGYVDPWRLGVDRWLALIGAHHEHPNRHLCLVSVGTAMTIDVLAANGRHRGGNIVPAPLLMIQSLLAGTAGIRRRAGGLKASARFAHSLSAAARPRRNPFGRSTYEGLLAGATLAAAAAIERAMTEARTRLRGMPRLLLSGGAADSIAPLLRARYVAIDDLVLRGLAVWAQSAE